MLGRVMQLDPLGQPLGILGRNVSYRLASAWVLSWSMTSTTRSAWA